ncbi:MAG: hypothetical protein RMI91_10680 [Gemmatales bacterium]|nr:hypothetical protein [Gemmatales bacterium]MDW7995108.1 hypothetical protein [Gemmatales bacterium]
MKRLVMYCVTTLPLLLSSWGCRDQPHVPSDAEIQQYEEQRKMAHQLEAQQQRNQPE